MSQPPAEPTTTPLEQSWITAALLLAGLGAYTSVFINTLFLQGLDDEAANALVNGLVLGLTAALTGLMVFVPARPPGMPIRLGVYGIPIGLLLWLVPVPSGSELLNAVLLPWALLTALYGVRGGLPKGWWYVLIYPAVGAVAYLLIATVWFNELVWLMPVLPFLLLLRSRYRKRLARTGVEILLAVLLAACIGAEFVILPQGESWLPYRSIVGTVCTISLFYTLVLLGLARYARFDTAEYSAHAHARRIRRRRGSDVRPPGITAG